MLEPKHLLTDDQMTQFITQGFVILNTDFSDAFHQTVLKKMKDVYATEGNAGNNILPRIPEIQQFFDHPTVRGGLTSVLGPDYIMHGHRHGHFNRPGSKGIAWHKDNYWGNEKIRNHQPWSAMIFYYPQDVTLDMGPSSIMPGTQNHYRRTQDQSEYQLPVLGKAGTMALIAYDIWHTAMPNSSELERFMLKFLFFRLEAPQRPSWNNKRREWLAPPQTLPVQEHSRMWETTWNWLSGSPGMQVSERIGEQQRNELTKQLSDPDEAVSIDAAYALASAGTEGVSALLAGLEDGVGARSFSPAHGLAAAGASALPYVLQAWDREHRNRDVYGHLAFILGELGEQSADAVPRMLGMLREESSFVRQHVVEALGMIRQPAALIVPALCDRLLQDPNAYIRFLAGLGLARIGREAEMAVPALRQSLKDENRYVPSIAAIALQRIRSDEALDVLLPFLQTSRWCPVTTKESTY